MLDAKKFGKRPADIVMLCESERELSAVPQGWIFEQKLDGIRCLYIKGRLINRLQRNITADYPEIEIPRKDVVLDGELVIFNQQGISDFNLIQNHKNNKIPATYVVFDVLEYCGKVLTSEALKERRKLLPDSIKGSKNVQAITDLAVPSWAEVKEKGYEGLIAKNPNSNYEFKRSKNWLKIKNFKEINGDILEVAESESPNGFTINFKPDGNLPPQRVAVQKPEVREAVVRALEMGIFPRAKIQYFEITKEGRLRMPTFRELYIDGETTLC